MCFLCLAIDLHLYLTKNLNNKQIQGVFDRCIKNESKAKKLIEVSFLSQEAKENYWKIMEEKYEQLRARN